MHPLDGLRRRDLCERGRVLYFRPRVLLVRAANLFDGVQPRSLLTVAQLHGRVHRRGQRDFVERQVVLGMRGRDFLFPRKRRCLFEVAQLQRGKICRGERDFIERQVVLGMRNRDVLGA